MNHDPDVSEEIRDVAESHEEMDSEVVFQRKVLVRHCKEDHNTKKPLEKLDDEQIPKVSQESHSSVKVVIVFQKGCS